MQTINKLQNADILNAIKTIDCEIEAINELKDLLDENLTKALDLIENAKGRIILSGMGKSGHIAKKIAASLASTGTPSFFIHPAEASHGDLGMVTDDDVIIAISNSGESRELIDILNYSKRFGIKLIAITKNPDSSLGKAGDIVLKLPQAKEACPLGLAPTSSTIAPAPFGRLVPSSLLISCIVFKKIYLLIIEAQATLKHCSSAFGVNVIFTTLSLTSLKYP